MFFYYSGVLALAYVLGAFYNVSFNIVTWSQDSKLSLITAVSVVIFLRLLFSAIASEEGDDNFLIP